MRTVWALAALLVIASPAAAQSNRVLQLQGYPQHGYVEIPFDAQLDTSAMTVEAWVSIRDAY